MSAQQCLYFLPEPQGQGAFRSGFGSGRGRKWLSGCGDPVPQQPRQHAQPRTPVDVTPRKARCERRRDEGRHLGEPFDEGVPVGMGDRPSDAEAEEEIEFVAVVWLGVGGRHGRGIEFFGLQRLGIDRDDGRRLV
jgi:hypothetical protein